MSAERLQKIMAQAGLGSRRSCEALIEQGRVTVNGRVARLGASADAQADEIRVDGEALPAPRRQVWLVLHKPGGVVSSRAAQGDRQTVCDLVPEGRGLYPVGRLDLDSEGLVLLTNDGALAERLTHPRYGHEKEYRVLLDRVPEAEQLEAWRKGVVLPDGVRTRPARVWRAQDAGPGAWIGVVLQEGRKRQLRETARALGLRVRRLVRTRLGTLELGRLAPGEWRRLTPAEVRTLARGRAAGPRRGLRRGERPSGRGKHGDG